MIIKKATLNDIDVIVDFYKRTAEYEKSLNSRIGTGHFDEENFRADIAREILLSEFYYAFAVENDEILGYIVWCIKEKTAWWTYRRMAYIDHIFVEEKHRKKGVAKFLMENFENFCKKFDVEIITIEAIPENIGAISAYEKLDFKPYMVHLWKHI